VLAKCNAYAVIYGFGEFGKSYWEQKIHWSRVLEGIGHGPGEKTGHTPHHTLHHSDVTSLSMKGCGSTLTYFY